MKNTVKTYVGIEEKLPLIETLPLSFQHLFAMFGATVLVPYLLHVNVAVVLLMNGLGTLLYSFITKGKIPAYLGSSFAFIAPVLLIVSKTGSFGAAQGAFIFFGLFFVVVSFIIKYVGIKWIDVIMPPAVMGSVVAVIGLELAPNAASQAGLVVAANASADGKVIFVSLATLCIGVFGTVLFTKFLKIIPILVSVVCGYVLALALGMVNFQPVKDAAWLAIPSFTAPSFNIQAILIILPACLVVLAEHIGHLIVTGNITEKDLMTDPGLHLSLLGDGLSNIISGFFGSTPNTTYGENIGVMAITRVYSVWVIRGAAILAIAFSFIGKISAIISTIPGAVMGGVTIMLYGVIATSGIRMLIEKKVDFSKGYNMMLAAVTFIIGVSGASIKIGTTGVELKGMSFAAVAGVILSICFYVLGKLGLMNEEYKPNN